MIYGSQNSSRKDLLKLKVALILHKMGVKHPNIQEDVYNIMGIYVSSYYYYDNKLGVFSYIP